MEEKEKKLTAASQMDAKLKLKLAATGMASNAKLQASQSGSNRGSTSVIDMDLVTKVTSDWPAVSKAAAQQMIEFYGPPNELTASRLFWYNNGPWKRTILYKEEAPHNFPIPHTDVLEQTINYRVPAEKVGDVALYEGSLVIDRTKGEVSVHCDTEGANILALNMMHEIVSGKRTPQEARDFVKEELVAFLMNRSAPYAETFQFDLPAGEQWDPDSPAVTDEVFTQAVKKIKDTLGFDDKG